MAFRTERHPANGMEMLVGKEHVLFSNGVLCTTAEYGGTTGMSADSFGAVMFRWEQDPKRQYDFRYAVTTGILRKKARQGGETESAEDAGEPEEPGEKPEEPPEKRRTLEPQAIIFLVMCVTGLMSAGMSAYHTAVAMTSFGRPLAIGIITGTVMVLFSATAFTAARWFLMERGAVKGFSLLFAALGTVIVVYSMMSTLTVNYDAWKGVSEEDAAENAGDSAVLASYDARLRLLEAEIGKADAEAASLEADAEYWRSMSWARYDATAAKLDEARQRQAELAAEYAELLASRPEAVAVVREETFGGDAFSFLAGFIPAEPATLRLFMQAVPAMFFDVIAPFALSCAVYLAERRRRGGDGRK